MYIDGFVTPVPKENKQKYLEHLELAAQVFKEFGATRLMEAWEDDVPKGEQTDFFRAVNASAEEAVLFSWIEWPSKEVRDEGMKKMFADERMKQMDMPFNGKKMIFGGFRPIFDKKL